MSESPTPLDDSSTSSLSDTSNHFFPPNGVLASEDVPFATILIVPAYFAALHAFMCSEFSEEGILFYIACTSYQEQKSDDLLQEAKHIFNMYVCTTALFNVGLPKDLVREIQVSIANQTPSPLLFESAKQAVARNIETNVYPRFLLSSSFRALCSRNWGISLPPEIPRELVKKSRILERSLQIATIASRVFSDNFYKTLFSFSPEATMLFQNNTVHQATALQGLMSSLLSFLKGNDKQLRDSVIHLAEMHLRMGITQSMFSAFGSAFISTLCDYLLLDRQSLESASIARHLRVAYNLVAGDIITGMARLGQEAMKPSLFTKGIDTPKWLIQQLTEYKSYTSLTLMLVSRKGKENFATKFYAKFFELSPGSSQHFTSPVHQSKALWGALNSVVKILEHPKKMRATLAKTAALHKSKGISQREATLFVRALRICFRVEIGSEYTERMDSVWKQFLELMLLFTAEATKRPHFSTDENPPDGYDSYASIVLDRTTNEQDSTRPGSSASPGIDEKCANFPIEPAQIQIADDASLAACLEMPLYVDAFCKFLRSEWQEESILFYLATRNYQLTSASLVGSERLELARQIHSLYLGPTALFSVNLPHSQQKEISQAIKNKVVSSNLFDESIFIIVDLMESDHVRFMASCHGVALRGLPLDKGVRPSARSIKQSPLLARFFQLAMNAVKTPSFLTGFEKELFAESPEAKLLFSNNSARQETALLGALSSFTTFLKMSDKEFAAVATKLAAIHLRMGITESMFSSFGKALISTLGQYFSLDPSSLESDAINRHWRAAYSLMTQEIVVGMTSLPTESKSLFSRDDTPKWLSQQVAEYHTYASLTLLLINKIGNDRFLEAFYTHFFELSPGSASKFASLAHQTKALWGSLNSVVKLLKHPRKMRRTLDSLRQSHKAKGIRYREYMCFVRALRATLRAEIGFEYTEKMDAVWKQFLELLVLFLSGGERDDSGRGSLTPTSTVDDLKPTDQKALVEMAANEPQSMSEVLVTPGYLEGLVDFMSMEFTEENVLFYIACVQFKSQAQGQPLEITLEAAKKMFALYIASSSLFIVTFPQSITRDILQAIANKTVTPNLFDAARVSVVKQMERDFERFVGSSCWPRTTGGMHKVTTKDKDPRQAIKQSSILGRSFQIATTKGAFAESFYHVLFQASPEAKVLFQNNLAHQGAALQGTLSNLLSFLKQSDKQFSNAAKHLSEIHLQMGITSAMFGAFGAALIETLRQFVNLEEKTLEWQAIKRHWQTAYDLITNEILYGMTQLEPAPSFFNRSKGAPKWLLAQLVEYKTFTSLTILLISKRGNDNFQSKFYTKFFEMSPESISKFPTYESQKTALWGALDSVVKLLARPNTMRSTFAKIAALHRTKGITHKQYIQFIRTLRITFRETLGEEYTERMDVVWKQFLELLLLFLVEKDDESGRGIENTRFEHLDDSDLSISPRTEDVIITSERSARRSIISQSIIEFEQNESAVGTLFSQKAEGTLSHRNSLTQSLLSPPNLLKREDSSNRSRNLSIVVQDQLGFVEECVEDDRDEPGKPLHPFIQIPFAEFLQNPSYLESFRCFMSTEFQDEKVLFYIACTKYEMGVSGGEVQIMELAKKIFELYLETTCLFPIGLPQENIDEIVIAMTHKEMTLTLFAKAKLFVVKSLERTAYPRFLKTPEWRAISTGQQLDPLRKYLGTSERNSRVAIQQSVLLRRSFQLATSVITQGESFSEAFYHELFARSPESQMLFGKNLAHQGAALQGALSNLISFLESSDNQFMAAVQRLSQIHFQMGITRSMFSAFGEALILTLQKYLAIDEMSLEWEAIRAHWNTAYSFISKEIVRGMTKTESKEPPKWLEAQLTEYKRYIALTMILIQKRGKDSFSELFFQQFFAISPDSVQKFESLAHQGKGLWGALNSVVKLIEKPRKMRRTMEKIALIHKDKNISHKEYMWFVQALRVSFQIELGLEYTEKMDAVWKQFLELLVLFLWEKDDTPEGVTLKFNELKRVDAKAQAIYASFMMELPEESKLSTVCPAEEEEDPMNSLSPVTTPLHSFSPITSNENSPVSNKSQPRFNYSASTKGDMSLTEFLSSPSNVETLFEFMKGEFYEEHMLFYKACLRYPNSTERLSAAQDIYSLYLHPGAIFHCNLPQTHNAAVQREIELGIPSIDLFELPKEQIIQRMQKDSYARFIATEKSRIASGGKSPRAASLRTVRQSGVVSRSFAIAGADSGFTAAFFGALTRSSPEAEMMFSTVGHPASFKSVFSNLLALLRQSERQFSIAAKRLSGTHLRMGISPSMFEAFGVALRLVVRSYVTFTLCPDEASALDRHWKGVYDLIATQILLGMTQLGPEAKGFFSKEQDAPKWLQQHLVEFNTYTGLTMLLIKKRGHERFVNAFYTRFFERSPMSEKKFTSAAQREAALFGALNAVVKLIKKPKSMRKTLLQVQNIHKDRGISYEEAVIFVQTLRVTMQNELGPDFSPKVDLCWNQFLELFLLFFSQGSERPDAEVNLLQSALLSVGQEEADDKSSLVGLSDKEVISPDISLAEEEYGPPPGLPRPGSFWDVIQDSAKFELLRVFANEEFQEENVLFFLACNKFQECKDAESLEVAAVKIYGTYLSPSALFGVSVEHNEAKDIMQALAERNIHLTMFERAKAMALRALERDTYVRFASTASGRLLRGIRNINSSSNNTKDPRRIKESSLLRRSLQLATSSSSSGATFLQAVYKEFFKQAPEVEVMFPSGNIEHLGAAFLNALGNFLSLLRAGDDKAILSAIRSLAEVHVTMGCTRSQFEALSRAFLLILRQFLELDASSLEWDAVSRHWQVAFELLSSEMIRCMIQLGPRSVMSTETDSALQKHFPEFEALASQTLALVAKVGDARVSDTFLSKFFLRSPSSAKKYENVAMQNKCFWGALNAVAGMFEHPRKFRHTLVQITKTHRGKSINLHEFTHFVRAVRETFQSELGEEYLDKMDGVWKRSLELCELFLGDDSIVYEIGPAPPPSESPSGSIEPIGPNAEFESLLNNPESFEMFQAFAQREFTEEQLLFYQACTKYEHDAEKQSNEEMVAAAQNVFALYLAPASLFYVGLSQFQLKRVINAIHSLAVTPETFRPGKIAAVLAMERELYPKFLVRSQTSSEDDSRLAIKKSLLLSRSFQLATSSFAMNGRFSEAFYNELFMEAPESKAMFVNNAKHQSAALQGALTNLLVFLKQPTKRYVTVVRRLSEVHFKMGINENMFEAFGIALIRTLRTHLQLEEKSGEWAAIERHWKVAYRLISSDILASMSEVPEMLYKKREMPEWVLKQAAEYTSYTQLTIHLVTQRGDEPFMEAFYNKFFELSPSSARRFASLAHQVKALWGAIKTVAKLLGKPAKMRQTLAKLAKVHRNKNITHKEYVLFARALRLAFRNELGEEYTDRIDGVWKQFLDLCTQFLAEKPVFSVPEMKVMEEDRDEDDNFAELTSYEDISQKTRPPSLSDSSGRARSGGDGSVKVRGADMLLGSDDTDPRNRLTPRELELLKQTFSEGRLASAGNLPAFFEFLHKCPSVKRLDVLNQYFMTSYCHANILEELLKLNQWKLWLLPISPPVSQEGPEEKTVARTRLMEYMILIIVEVFCYFFRNFDENDGVVWKTDASDVLALDFERRGKEATMADFLLDAISYISLLHSREVTTRILTAFITKIGAWNASLKPRWAMPAVSEHEWPNFFSMLAGLEEYLFFSNRKEKSALRKERKFSLGIGPIFPEITLVAATCKLLHKLKFDRWNDLPENDVKLGKLQLLYQGKGQQEEQFFNGVRDFFKLSAEGRAQQQTVAAFVMLLMGRKQVYGTKAHVEKLVVRFLEGPSA